MVPLSGDIGVRIMTLQTLQAGPGLDNVVLTQSGGGIPEPAAWAMLILGFGFVGAMQRRGVRIAAM